MSATGTEGFGQSKSLEVVRRPKVPRSVITKGKEKAQKANELVTVNEFLYLKGYVEAWLATKEVRESNG